MIPLKEIGECLISDGDQDFFFRPSFIAMTQLGTPAEIVATFHDLFDDSVARMIVAEIQRLSRVSSSMRILYTATTGKVDDQQWLLRQLCSAMSAKRTIMAAHSVIQACCDRDATPLIGELIPGKSGKWTFVYRAGKLPVADMITVARSLIVHGLIGKAKVRRLQRHESSTGSTEFSALEYINAARNHFEISRHEAEQLTMTEFQMMIAMKYPDQKGFTREEYDKVADDYLAKKKRKLARSQRGN